MIRPAPRSGSDGVPGPALDGGGEPEGGEPAEGIPMPIPAAPDGGWPVGGEPLVGPARPIILRAGWPPPEPWLPDLSPGPAEEAELPSVPPVVEGGPPEAGRSCTPIASGRVNGPRWRTGGLPSGEGKSGWPAAPG